MSSIDGISWSKPKTLITGPEEGGNPKVISNKLAVTKTGAWVLPYWGEVRPGIVWLYTSVASGCKHLSRVTSYIMQVLLLYTSITSDFMHSSRLTVHVYMNVWPQAEVSSARGCRNSQSTVSGVLVSKDHGHTWKPHGKVHPRGGQGLTLVQFGST